MDGREKMMKDCNKGLSYKYKKIWADLQTQGTTVSARTICRHLNEMGRYGRRPHCWQRHKARLEFAITYLRKPKSFWENVMWTDEPKYSFLVKHITVLFTENERGLQRKEHVPYGQRWWRFTDVLGLLCCFWHQMPWLCAWHHEIWRLPKNFGVQFRASVRNLGLHQRSWLFQQTMTQSTHKAYINGLR